MKNLIWLLIGSLFILLAACTAGEEVDQESVPRQKILHEYNTINPRPDGPSIAIIGVTLIDGTGAEPIPDAVVVVDGDRIITAGPRNETVIPDEAEIFEAEGLTLLPGLIDAHFHSTNNLFMPNLFLHNGITSLRDPGHPFSFYQSLYFADRLVPRIFLTGAHLDGNPPVWSQQAVIIRDKAHARQTVQDHVENGGTAIKIYFALPSKYYEVITRTASELGVPVVAHLEMVDADVAIKYGVNGIEHVTSFGTSLADSSIAEVFRQKVSSNYGARKVERFQLWSTIDIDSERVREVLALAAEHNVVLTPTLALYERRPGAEGVEEYHVEGYRNMMRFVEQAWLAGVQIAVSSHSSVRYAELGWALHREMEVLVESGMDPMDVIRAATYDNARFFRTEERLGSIQPGKLADLLLIEGDPLQDISAIHNVRRVMLNGEWVE